MRTIKILEGIGGVSFGFGIGAGILYHLAIIGTISFLVAGCLWLIAQIMRSKSPGSLVGPNK